MTTSAHTDIPRPIAAIFNPLPGVTYAANADAARWLEQGDWLDTTMGEALRAMARRQPDAPAFISDERSLTFGELDSLSERLGAALLREGLDPGDRVIVQLGTTVDTVVALMGLYKAGLVPVCSIPQYREVEITQLATLSRARGYLVQADFGGFDLPAFADHMRSKSETLEHVIIVRGHRPEIGPDLETLIASVGEATARSVLAQAPVGPGDVLSFQLSGGTTGVPKIIPRFHAEYLGHSLAGMRRFQFDGDSRMIWPLPLLHNAAQLYALTPPLLLGSATVLMPRVDIARLFDLVEAHQVTHAVSIGPVGAQILNYSSLDRHDLSSLKMFGTMSGAETLEARIKVPCVNFYGITEGLLLGSGPGDRAEMRHQTNGLSGALGDELRLIDPETGLPAPDGADGELTFRGPSTLLAYYNAPDITAEVLGEDGFFRSGDIMRPVTIDGATAYSFQGRTRDNINRGGEKIACEEVEAFIATHPDIAEARLIAMPDPMYGEKGCLFVIARPGVTSPDVASLGAFLVQRGLAKFKCPERVEAIEEFPVTRVGKLDRAALRTRIREILEQEARAGEQVAT